MQTTTQTTKRTRRTMTAQQPVRYTMDQALDRICARGTYLMAVAHNRAGEFVGVHESNGEYWIRSDWTMRHTRGGANTVAGMVNVDVDAAIWEIRECDY